jgi:hypothetical protein
VRTRTGRVAAIHLRAVLTNKPVPKPEVKCAALATVRTGQLDI